MGNETRISWLIRMLAREGYATLLGIGLALALVLPLWWLASSWVIVVLAVLIGSATNYALVWLLHPHAVAHLRWLDAPSQHRLAKPGHARAYRLLLAREAQRRAAAQQATRQAEPKPMGGDVDDGAMDGETGGEANT